MARYLASDTLRDAVHRLSESIAQGGLADFLIFKRALSNTRKAKKSATAVVTGLESKPFQEAIRELAECAVGGTVQWNGPPFFSPFGASRDRQHGFKSAKYPSNGPSDTVGGWQSRSGKPLRVVADSSPKAYEFETRTEPELRTFLLKKQSGDRPRLLDAARWWFRGADVESRFNHEPTGQELVDGFVADLDLKAPECAALFEPVSPEEATSPAGSFDSTLAAPASYLPPPTSPAPTVSSATSTPSSVAAAVDLENKVDHITRYIASRGFVFAPWQIAAYVTAVRTKPFVILAGISGTGKTKLPRLVAQATGADIDVIPVHPDWTDGSELIGYERIGGEFVPGRLLRLARKAQENPTKQYFALLDEMNIARVEYYLADVLSHIEERDRVGGALRSKPLAPSASNDEWKDVCLPSNLCVVGSVNMDETTHGFSRKVLDRSFVIEFSEVDLTRLGDATGTPVAAAQWSADDWVQRHLTLAEHPERSSQLVEDAIEVLETINDALNHAQIQVGYRVRDEIALFRLNARECGSAFRGLAAAAVDPLDLAITMKILPRIQGGGAAIQQVLDALKAWSTPQSSSQATSSSTPPPRAFPLSQERIALMSTRLRSGFTQYWL